MRKYVTKGQGNISMEVDNYGLEDFKSVASEGEFPVKTKSNGKLDVSFIPNIPSGLLPNIPSSLLPTALLDIQSAKGNTLLSNSLASFSDIDGLTFTAAEAGNYFFLASLDVVNGGANGSSEYAFFKNGILVNDSQRRADITTSLLGVVTISLNNFRIPVTLFDKISCAANDTVTVRWRSINGQTLQMEKRSLFRLRVT